MIFWIHSMVHHRFLFYTRLLLLAFGVSLWLPAPAHPGDDLVKQRMRAVTPLTGVTPAQWRVIWKETPATTAVISWSTAGEGSWHRVYYDTVACMSDLDAYSFAVDTYRNGRYTLDKGEKDDIPAAYYHHAMLINLEPSTTYYFTMVSDHEVSREFHFTTAPADDRDFSMLFGGDSRSDHVSRSKINLLIARFIEENPGLLAFAHAGDYVNTGKKWKEWSLWLSHHELTVPPSGRILPVIPARGNHDTGMLFNEIFDWPGIDGKNYYASRLSSTVALVTLNTEISTGGDQRRWLARQLQVLRPNTRWLTAQYHRPVYPAVKAPSAARPHWVPLFERYNMDMVYEADGHTIKRTVPIRNDRPDSTGVVYVGEGGLGVKQRTPRKKRWYLKPPGMADRGHHVVRVDFSSAAMRYRVIMLDGTIRDTYSFKPRTGVLQGASGVSEF